MKIYFYSHTLQPGGAEKQCALLAAELKRRFGYETVILLNNGSGIKEEYLGYIKSSNVAIEVLPANFIKRNFRLYAIFRGNRDGVLFNYLTYPDFFGGFAAWAAGLRVIVGGIETDRMFGKKFWAEYVAHKCFSDVTICNSHKAFDFFAARGFDKNRMVVLPSGIETCDLKLAKPEDDSSLGIISVGRFVREKDYSTWVKVIAKLHALRPHVHATIIGYGPLELSVRKEIAGAHLEKVARILPGQSTNVFAELTKSHVYLSTSIQEGTSNTILEGMAHGLPVVATNVGDNEYMIEDGVNGFLREPGDVDGLAKALVRLVDSHSERMKMGEQSRRKVEASYSLDVIVRKYYDIISSCEKQL